jgi:hypothetical protein
MKVFTSLLIFILFASYTLFGQVENIKKKSEKHKTERTKESLKE